MRAFLKAYNFIKTSIWKDDTSDCFVFQTAQKIYNKIKSRFTKNKVLIRISGQSGSGKTSQLFQANNYSLRYSKIKPIHLAVRNFAKFYPKLNSNSKFSTSFRETTNGFALKILIWILKFSLDDNLVTSLDMPILFAIKDMGIIHYFIYGFIILIAILTSAVSSGYSLVNIFKKNKNYRYISFIICLSSILFYKIDFSYLISSLYPILGVIGIIQILYLLLKKAPKTDIN